MAEVSITLVPRLQSNYQVGEHVGFRIRIEAREGVGIDDEIFRYFEKPTNLAGVTEGTFSGVCSWPDMLELPTDAPEPDTSPASYRLAYMDIVVSSESIATEIWDLVQTQVEELCQTIKDGNTLETGDSIDISSI